MTAVEAACADALYDTHTHVFTAASDRYPINIGGAREGEQQLRRRIRDEPMTPERLLALWDRNRVAGGAGVQYNTVYKTDNSYLLDSSERYPERLSAVVILDAAAPSTPQTLERLVATRNIAGLRLFGRPDDDGAYPWLDSEAALETWRVVADHSLRMVVMYAPAGPTHDAFVRIAALAARFPGVAIALDHFGWPGYDPETGGPDPLLSSLCGHRNVHFKLTSINFAAFAARGIDAARFLRRAADLFGAERMMWGSDAGNTLEDYDEMAAQARAASALLSAAERRQFLFENGSRLFARAR